MDSVLLAPSQKVILSTSPGPSRYSGVPLLSVKELLPVTAAMAAISFSMLLARRLRRGHILGGGL